MPLIQGYAYKLGGSTADWRSCPDERWETGLLARTGSRGAKFLGFRCIDGTRCTVWETRTGCYAQSAIAAKPPRGMG